MALRRLSLAACTWLIVCAAALPAFASKEEPSVGHGLGKMLAGVFLVWPGTILDATLTNPPVVGTMVGIFAGAVRASQSIAAGAREVSAGFDPWGAKKRTKRR